VVGVVAYPDVAVKTKILLISRAEGYYDARIGTVCNGVSNIEMIERDGKGRER
jgi:hypothetical protein